MIKFEKIEADNFVLFDHLSVPLNTAPITVVRGQNHDRQQKDSSNASGKSLFASLWPMVLFAEPPLSVRKKSGKDFMQKTSSVALTFSHNKIRYKVVQQMKGKTLDLKVFKNGKDLQFRKSEAARQYLASLIPLTATQFYSMYYMDARSPSLLQRGTPAQRFSYFEDIFKLGIHDHISGMVNRQYSQLILDQKQLDTLRSEYSVQKNQLKIKVGQHAIQHEKFDKLKLDKAELEEKINKWQTRLLKMQRYLVLTKDWHPDAFKINDTNYAESIKELDTDIAVLEKDYKESIAEDERIQMALQVKASLEKISTKLKDLKKLTEKPVDLSVSAKIDKLRIVLKKYTTFDKTAWDTLKGFIKPSKDLLPDQWRLKLGRVQQALIEKQALIKFLENDDSHTHHDKCPVCGSHLTLKMKKAIIATTQKEIIAFENKIATYRQYIKYADLKQQLPTDTWQECQVQQKRLQEKLDILLNKADKNKKIEEARTVYFELEKQEMELTVRLKKLKTVKLTMEAKAYEELLNDMRERKIGLTRIYTQSQQLKEYPADWTVEKVKVALKKYGSLASDLKSDLVLLHSKYHKLSAALTHDQIVLKNLLDLKKKIKQLKIKTQDVDIFVALKQAFSTKGLKRQKIVAMADLFVANLNKYAGLIFGEKIRFQSLIETNNFTILATRNNKTSDIRYLSNSESRAFILLSLLALLPFIPKEYQSSMIVLDEMESGLDSPSKQLFVKEFLPLLNTIIPHIFIVTPQADKEFHIPNAQVWTIEKKNGVSRLKGL